MDSSDILRRSREAAQRLSSFGKRETERLRGLGIPVQPHTDHASFLTLPGNISDVDLAVPHSGNLPELQKKLEAAGVPFRRMHGENAVHSYTTPDGIWVDVGIRPQRELDYINRGLEGLSKLSPEQKKQLLLEKYRMHAAGDAAAYKKWKQDFYESHNIFPKGGDFSKVAANYGSLAALKEYGVKTAVARPAVLPAMLTIGDSGGFAYGPASPLDLGLVDRSSAAQSARARRTPRA